MTHNPYEELEKRWGKMSLSQLAAEIREIKTELEARSAEKTRVQKIYDHLTIAIVPERMDDEDVQTMKVEGVGRLQAMADIRCSCLAANREKLYEWLEEHGHDAMVGTTVNASTLKAFVKEQIKQDGEYPKDLLKIEPYSRATVVKS